MKRLISIALLLCAAAAFAGDVEDVRRLDTELSVATWTRDKVWFEENLSDDFVHVTATGALKNKRELINDLVGPGLVMQPYEPLDMHVRVYGDAAVVTGRVIQQYRRTKYDVQSEVRYTDFYAKRKGRWIFVSSHVSTISMKVTRR
ncbi:MAG: nuclear transport factor 2 family protein [Thermoanaerobaculia bacterium]